MKKQFTILLLAILFLATGCSKDKKSRMYNEELVGKKFRAKAYIHGPRNIQVYEVFEFIDANTVKSGLRFDDPILANDAYLLTLKWRKDGTTGTGIIVNYRAIMKEDKKTREIKGIITEANLSFPDKDGKVLFEEY